MTFANAILRSGLRWKHTNISPTPLCICSPTFFLQTYCLVVRISNHTWHILGRDSILREPSFPYVRTTSLVSRSCKIHTWACLRRLLQQSALSPFGTSRDIGISARRRWCVLQPYYTPYLTIDGIVCGHECCHDFNSTVGYDRDMDRKTWVGVVQLMHATIISLKSVLGSTTYGSSGLSKLRVGLVVFLYSYQGVQCDVWPLPGALLCVLSGNDGWA